MARYSQVSRAMQELYQANPKGLPIEQLKEKILSEILAAPIVKRALWEDDYTLSVMLDDEDSFGHGIIFSPRLSSKLDMEQTSRTASAIRKEQVSQLEQHLKQGGTIVFTSFGSPLRVNDVRGKILDVMTRPNLTSAERLTALKNEAFDGSEEAALDLLANYSASEWASSK